VRHGREPLFFSAVIRAATIALADMMVIVNKLTPVGYPANHTNLDTTTDNLCRCSEITELGSEIPN